MLPSGRSPEPMRLLPISTAHSASNGRGREGGVGWGCRIVGFYFCFVAALLTRSPLKFNQAESVCSQASGCSAAPACRECGVFKERKQAGRHREFWESWERRCCRSRFRRRGNNRTCHWGGKHESALSQIQTRRFENKGEVCLGKE